MRRRRIKCNTWRNEIYVNKSLKVIVKFERVIGKKSQFWNFKQLMKKLKEEYWKGKIDGWLNCTISG